MKILILSLFLFPGFLFASDLDSRATYTAKRFYEFINNNNLKGIINAVKTVNPDENMSFTDNADLSKKITAKLNGDTINFDGNLSIKFTDDGTIFVSGQKFKYDDSVSFQKNYQNILGLGSKFSKVDLFIPKAHASGFEIGGAIAAFGALAAIGTVVVIFVGNEIYEAVKNGAVECNGIYFSVRTKIRKALVWASSKQTVLDPKEASILLGKKIEKCTEESAAQLKATLQNRKLFSSEDIKKSVLPSSLKLKKSGSNN